MEYTPEEEKEAITAMENAAKVFYGMAVATNVHAFIEFTGLMNEFIKICRNTPGFMMANTHNERPLNMERFHVAYLAEKLDCIYGPTLRSRKELMDALAAQVEG